MNYSNLDEIFKDISKEIDNARKTWGTSFDDKNTLNDWLTYVNIYASQAARMDTPKEQVRPRLIEAAGLLISAIERLDVNGKFALRHYDRGEN